MTKTAKPQPDYFGFNEYLLEALVSVGADKILAKKAAARANNRSLEYYELIFKNDNIMDRIIRLETSSENLKKEFNELQQNFQVLRSEVNTYFKFILFALGGFLATALALLRLLI